MNQRLEWDIYDNYHYLINYLHYRKAKLTNDWSWKRPRTVAFEKIMSIEETNRMIGEAIITGEPFWVGRYGDTENNLIYSVLRHRMHPKKDTRREAVKNLCLHAGFFPESIDGAEKFTDLMISCCSEMDLQGVWRRYMEDYFYIRYQKRHAKLTHLGHLEPWEMYNSEQRDNIKPWSAALKGKKVLVIHPFAASIEKQYRCNREKIFNKVFDADDILPEFELITIKAVQTIANEKDERFTDWFEALEWMVQECKKKEFDVAIIGCGAYGFPLAAEIKRMGKVAIHLGGATQLLFGIVGKRWEKDYPDFCKNILNEYWVRPSNVERIKLAEKIEDACYW